MLLSVIVANTVTIVGLWFKMQNRIERLEEKKVEDQRSIDRDCAEMKRQIEAIWDWKDEHEKNANDIREKYNRELSRLEGANLVVNEQFKQIMNILEDIKERISELEKK